MVSSTESSTDSLGTAVHQLRELVTRGFRFVHPRDDNGQVVAVVGVRPHEGFVDVVLLQSESDAKAMRLPGDEKNVLAPATVLWETTGPAPEVLAELLALSAERVSGSAWNHSTGAEPGHGASTGCWIPVSPGTAHWLTPTA
jgi:hypothetical protein